MLSLVAASLMPGWVVMLVGARPVLNTGSKVDSGMGLRLGATSSSWRLVVMARLLFMVCGDGAYRSLAVGSVKPFTNGEGFSSGFFRRLSVRPETLRVI